MPTHPPDTAGPIPPELLERVLAEHGDWYGFRMILLGAYYSAEPFALLAKQHDLLRDEFTVLGILSDYGEMTANVICAMSGRPKNSISRAVIRLTERTLIDTRASVEDRRFVILSVRPKGRRLYEEALLLFRERESELFGSLSPREMQSLDRLLAKLLSNWHRRGRAVRRNASET